MPTGVYKHHPHQGFQKGNYSGVKFRFKEGQLLREKNPNWKGGITFDVRDYKRKYQKKWLQNPQNRIRCNMATAICLALKGKKAGRKWELLVGYSLQDLMEHLERQFDKLMNWDNYGSYWEVDHKKPQSWFKYGNPEDKEFKKCWSLSNLQPLSAKENNTKKKKE